MGAISMGMRQRFEDGGDVSQGAITPAFAALMGRLNGAAPQGGTPVPRPPMAAVNATMPAPSGPPDQPQAGGAMAAGVGDQNADPEAPAKLSRIEAAKAILQAGGGVPSEQPGAVNLPLLAAAGAMLGPTRTGGFSESLGSGLTAGAGALQQQRTADEQARLRQAQQADTALWRQGMLGVNQQRADTGDMNAQTRQWVAERTVANKAAGLSDTAAYRQALIDARLYGIDTRADTAANAQAARSSDVQYRTDAGTATAQAKLDQQRARWLKSDAAKTEDQRLRRLGVDSRLINSAIIAASKDIGVMTGKTQPGVLIDKYIAEQRKALAAPPSNASPSGGGSPSPAAPAQNGAPAPGTPAQPAAPAGSAPAGAGAGARPATPGEIASAQKYIARNPANRGMALEWFQKNGVIPPAGL